MSRIESAGMATGYRFRVRACRVKESVGAAVLIENKGVAPIYRDAFPAVDGVRSEFNLRDLMPAQQAWVRIAHPGVSASPVISIACDHLVEGQRIGFDTD